MTKKQEMFCKEYILDFNATRAYAVAYGRKSHDKTCTVESCRLLANPSIREYIGNLIKPKFEKLDISAEYVLKRLKENADEAYKVSDGSQLPDFNAQNKALELLGKYLKLFTDKHEHTGEDGKPIESKVTIEFVKAK